MRELGLGSPNSFSLIEENSGVDYIFSHPDEQIAPEKKKLMVGLPILRLELLILTMVC